MTDRDALVERHDGHCPWCGHPLPVLYAVHHRQLRSQGGDDSPANLVCLCHSCHNGSTQAVHHQPSIAYERGFLVHSWDDPTEIPLLTASGGLVLLHTDGTTTQQGDTSWPEKPPSHSSETWGPTPS